MARVNATEVKAIMDGCTLSDPTITPFITAANLVVTNILGGTTLGDTLLKEIERWYAAHLLSCTLHRTTEEEKLEEAAVKFTGKYGMGLDATPYGQQVKILDTSGLMNKAGKRAVNIVAIQSFT